MKYYLIAGEASGDLHASNLMTALNAKEPHASFRYFGGDRMQSVGGTLVKHYRELAYMGVIPVLLNMRTILRNMQLCCDDIRNYKPDAVILVDYPGFNLKIAKFVKTHLKAPVYYYISPKIWAWRKYRIKTIRRYVDRMLCIFPFEVDFYKSLNYPVEYVGNPTVDAVEDFRRSLTNQGDNFYKRNGLPEKPVLAILAGSRKAEIKQNLPAMLAAVKNFPDLQPVIAGAPGLTIDDYKQAMADLPDTCIIFDQTYPILAHASFALVTSGTATLEAALFRVPQVVCYYKAGGKLVNFVFKHFFHVPYISLVNLIHGSEVVQEFFGADFKTETIRKALSQLIQDDSCRKNILDGYANVITLLGDPGASNRTAQLILSVGSHTYGMQRVV